MNGFVYLNRQEQSSLIMDYAEVLADGDTTDDLFSTSDKQSTLKRVLLQLAKKREDPEILYKSLAFDNNQFVKEDLRVKFDDVLKKRIGGSIVDNQKYSEAFEMIMNYLSENSNIAKKLTEFKSKSTPLEYFRYEGYCNNNPPKR
ncbi:MAG: hypothetical protein IPO72_14715 [Saprospiraceae bacterium]|nr:hypothetical protein [Candidatus Vicinibacter affinis]MBK6571598.1 hypothetical protein [Candidatus Vicinibacter affinis]MBK6822186.1 hypothetical protein [Candidatus Vicinibacter affinis]MBK7797973.1 hypothetical protein [Candidatus Vicinibacter affinis]MBK8641181.1 hypothetical protein [Candidatus Vicinibacter affinis]